MGSHRPDEHRPNREQGCRPDDQSGTVPRRGKFACIRGDRVLLIVVRGRRSVRRVPDSIKGPSTSGDFVRTIPRTAISVALGARLGVAGLQVEHGAGEGVDE